MRGGCLKRLIWRFKGSLIYIYYMFITYCCQDDVALLEFLQSMCPGTDGGNILLAADGLVFDVSSARPLGWKGQ